MRITRKVCTEETAPEPRTFTEVRTGGGFISPLAWVIYDQRPAGLTSVMRISSLVSMNQDKLFKEHKQSYILTLSPLIAMHEDHLLWYLGIDRTRALDYEINEKHTFPQTASEARFFPVYPPVFEA
jgi:hypothetical protein